jgi:hypothetical protein
VTVLFADVANCTSLSEKLDPKEIHQTGQQEKGGACDCPALQGYGVLNRLSANIVWCVNLFLLNLDG